MNREIKFRGKAIDGGMWVYGYLIRTTNTAIIVADNAPQGITNGYTKIKIENATPVNPNTVGEYTGLKDKNGKEIYEGDVCKRNGHTELYEIVFYKSAWAIKNQDDKAIWHQEFCNGAKALWLEVIGSIHENPELLK